MRQYREEYLAAFEERGGDVEGRGRALALIKGSDVRAYGEPVPYSYIPHLFGPDDVAFLEGVSRMTHAILSKMIARYVEDPGYRRVFRYPPELERLILLPCPYGEMLPMGRFDLFLDEEDRSFKFCEFNTDGSGAFSRDYEGGRALMAGGTFQGFAAAHEVRQFELFDSWVEAFMATYRSSSIAVEDPVVAITDFEESVVGSDVTRFLAAFERAGLRARFVDVRALAFDGERLVDPSDGTAIDAIYRRAVTSELLQHPGECDALIDAVAAQRVCLVGHFRTTVVHTKVVSIALFDPATRALLTPEERAFVDAHVPRTYRLEAGAPIDLAAVCAEKDGWIIKPDDDYGAHGVFAGIDYDQAEWERLVAEKTDAGYVVQEYCLPPTVELAPVALPADGDARRVEPWHTMPGLYTYNGRFAGLYVREGREGIIALDHGGLVAPSFRVDC